MTVLEELKTTQDSLLEKARAASELAAKKAEENAFESEFENSILDALSLTRTMYQQSIIEARHADTLEEIAEIWKETQATYEGMFSLWSGMNAILGQPQDKLFVYWGELIKELEAASREHYEFHG
jgi:hypothetical protein